MPIKKEMVWASGFSMRAAIVALAAIGVLAATPQPAAAAPDRDELRRDLKQLLRGKGHDTVKAGVCRPRRGERVYACRWRAWGTYSGEVPYKCIETARYRVRKRSWRIPPCENILRPQVPLLDEPGPHPAFGFNEGWHLEPGKFDELAGVGADTARQALYWSAVERERGSYDWRTFDDLYERMLARGVRPLFIAFAAPCWAQPDPARCRGGKTQLRPAPAHYDDFAEFVRAAALRYPQALGIEIWNEPNSDNFWGRLAQPGRYASMLKQAAGAVHASGSGVPVVSGGLLPFAKRDKGETDPLRFLRGVYRRGGAQEADAIGYHPYPGRAFNDDYLGSIRAQLHSVGRVQRSFDDGSKPIWATEMGVSTAGPTAYGEKQQARALADIYRTLRRVEGVPVVILHRFIDQRGSSANRETGYGVLRPAGARKPAFCSLAAAREAPC